MSRSAITEFLPFFNSLLQRCKYSVCNKDSLKVYTIYLPQKCTKENIRLCWLDSDSKIDGSGFVVYLSDSNVQRFLSFFLLIERTEGICFLQHRILRRSEKGNCFLFK